VQALPVARAQRQAATGRATASAHELAAFVWATSREVGPSRTGLWTEALDWAHNPSAVSINTDEPQTSIV
jgi:hypothetical protein